MSINDTPGPLGEPARVSPILPDDPVKVGDFWLDARLTATPSGLAYVAHDENATSVMLILLSQGAASDPGARDRLAGEVNQMDIDTVVARGGQGQDAGRFAMRYRPDSDAPTGPDAAPQAPWVALAYDGTAAAAAEAYRVLGAVELAGVEPQGAVSGPDFSLHWIDQFRPGTSRLWPLPWPGRHDRSGALSIVAAWLLMILLAALAVLIAILIFQKAPPVSPPPPVPTTSSASPPPPSSASPSPQSASPSPQSASPSPQSASPSPQSASPSPGSSASGGGSPSPPSRL